MNIVVNLHVELCRPQSRRRREVQPCLRRQLMIIFHMPQPQKVTMFLFLLIYGSI
ncbi:hypothetical protein IC582_020574 [Cucumis melo]